MPDDVESVVPHGVEGWRDIDNLGRQLQGPWRQFVDAEHGPCQPHQLFVFVRVHDLAQFILQACLDGQRRDI